MRSPRGFTARAPICCRSMRLSSQSRRGRRRVKKRKGLREADVAGPKASAPSPQVALLVPVQCPKPVVEAEQTGLRDCGTEGGRVTRPRALGTRRWTLPGRPRAVGGEPGFAGGDARRGPGAARPGCRGRDDARSRVPALPPETRGADASRLPPVPLSAPPPPHTHTPAGLEDTWPPSPGSGRAPDLDPGSPRLRSRAPSGPPASPGRSPAPRSQPVSRRMLSASGMRAAWEPREPMAAPAEPPGPAR